MGDNDNMEKGLQMKEKSAFVGEMEKSGENEIAIASEELVGSIRPLICLLYTSPSPRDRTRSRMPSSA